VWRKLEDQPSYHLLAQVGGSQNQFSSPVAADGFRHQYIVRAVKSSGGVESWSNPSIIELQHPITVPNVFTPNGDAYNEFFYIRKIELYTNSDLMVVDRWGMKVFEAVGYKNDWSGEGLSTGVYYYVLDLKRDNKVLQGSVQILK
jgi:gliding motility-associated-like protein